MTQANYDTTIYDASEVRLSDGEAMDPICRPSVSYLHTQSNRMSDQDMRAGELTFEHAVTRLEEIVAALEDDSLDLESALKAYEEGVLLARKCLERLDAAEVRIQEISLDDD